EMIMRKLGAYPPFYFLALITVSAEDLMNVIKTTEKITKYVRSQLSKNSIILGPSSSPIMRMNNRYRYQCLIKYKQEPNLTAVLQKIQRHFHTGQRKKDGLTISIDIDPYMMM